MWQSEKISKNHIYASNMTMRDTKEIINHNSHAMLRCSLMYNDIEKYGFAAQYSVNTSAKFFWSKVGISASSVIFELSST